MWSGWFDLFGLANTKAATTAPLSYETFAA
jgi:hypothetical protein